MEDLEKLFDKAEAFPKEVQRFADECLTEFRRKLCEYAASRIEIREKINNDWQAPSPQQTKKRAKCLSLLEEEVLEKNMDLKSMCNTRSNASAKSKASVESQESIKTSIPSIPIPAPRNVVQDEVVNAESFEAKNLMPPPAAPIQPAVVANENNSSLSETSYSSSGRPQRAAKLKSEKCLKEPKLNEKLRRPSNFGVIIKKENEQRESQMHLSQTSINSDESVVIVPGKPTSMVILNSDNDEESNQSNAATRTSSTVNSKSQKDHIEEESAGKQLDGGRQLRVIIKREKISLDPDNASKELEAFKVPPAAAKPKEKDQAKTTDVTAAEESSNESTTTSASTTAAASNKKACKKKVIVRPIKVERFSDLAVKSSPIASRTRKARCSQKSNKNIISGGCDTETAPLNESGPKIQKSLDNNEMAADDKKITRSASIYEDAIENPPTNAASVQQAKAPSAGEMAVNETYNVGTANDATFCTNQPAATEAQTTFVLENNLNSTVTLKKHSGGTGPADMTFDVCKQSEQNPKKDDGQGGHQSFETAKNVSAPNSDSLITEDESIEGTPPLGGDSNKLVGSKSVTTSASKIATKFKGCSVIKTLGKFPANRAKELFNPSAQSPVKMRVEAFESVAASSNANAAAPISKNLSRLKKKENAGSSSNTTPIIGKLQTPVLGRFLTPTQTTNIPLSSTAAGKKLASSASKATMPLHKSVSASNLKQTTSSSQLGGSGGAVRRENSADDIRRALLSQAEERKKQREQKNKMAAMAREAKERERAARLEKIKQEREEKRLKREQEMEKKRQLDEINRKLREEEEAEMEQKKREMEIRKLREQEKMALAIKLKAKQELQQKQYQQQQQQQQIKPQTMPPPAPKVPQSKYTFEMLDEYDSTDDEDKTSYKRPPPPTWSRRHVRGAAILMQQYMCTNIIDNFFSVQPMTPDLKAIFPNIDARYLKRNSSAFWTTPPRYSELPKY